MKWLREPLVHFLLLGALLFGLSTVIGEGRKVSPKRIEITATQVESLLQKWSAQWRRPPTEAELHSLVNDLVREEVLYREAVAMGLDQDDTIVRRRLAQKLEFLTEDLAASRNPTEADLTAFFNAHPERYRIPGRVSFSHIYFNTDKRGAAAEQNAKDTLARLRAGVTSPSAELGDPLMLEYQYHQQTPQEVEALFGREFAEALFQSPPGDWQGPIVSGYGLHLVRVDEQAESRLSALAEVQEQVRRDWIDEQRRQANEELYKRLRARYEVVIESGAVPGPAIALRNTGQGDAQ